MPTGPTLPELQRRLEPILAGRAGPETLAEATASLPVSGGRGLDAAARLSIYAGMIFVRLRDAIGEEFPATMAAIGAEPFDDTVARYLGAHPSDHADLRRAGRRLPSFLRAGAPGWIADLADLELALSESFTAADARVLRAADLEALPPEAWPSFELRGVPSLRLLVPSSPSDEIRRRLLDGEEARPADGAAAPLCIWRRDLRVFERRCEAIEHAALNLVARGIAFGDLCEWLADQEIPEDPPAAAVKLLRRWLADEILAADP